jgi:O-methyltransferase involved in polyketide biosynthesis
MSEADAKIHNISDTARWAAVYRAREHERSDAAFRDPYARRLAGERGEAIARSMPFSEEATWAWIARTYLSTSSSRNAFAPARTWW